MEDLISIIVPVYNVEKYLNKCIDSILDQTYKNLEIILVDDGSIDNSGKICNEYTKKDRRIKVIHKDNGGVSSARNIGIQKSTGKWLSFIDSDDWIEKEYFEKMYSVAIKENADVVLCGYNRIYENRKETINSNDENESYNSKEYLIKVLNPQTGFGFCHMKLIKRKCLKEIRFDEKLVVGEDALFNIELSKNIRRVFFLKQALYNYVNNMNSVVKKYDDFYDKKYLYSMEINKKYIFENYDEKDIEQNLYNFIAYHVMLIAVNYCFHPHNSNKNKINILKNVCNQNLFKEAIKKCNYENISLTRKITLFTLKHKLYYITAIICKYRQLRN